MIWAKVWARIERELSGNWARTARELWGGCNFSPEAPRGALRAPVQLREKKEKSEKKSVEKSRKRFPRSLASDEGQSSPRNQPKD